MFQSTSQKTIDGSDFLSWHMAARKILEPNDGFSSTPYWPPCLTTGVRRVYHQTLGLSASQRAMWYSQRLHGHLFGDPYFFIWTRMVCFGKIQCADTVYGPHDDSIQPVSWHISHFTQKNPRFRVRPNGTRRSRLVRYYAGWALQVSNPSLRGISWRFVFYIVCDFQV